MKIKLNTYTYARKDIFSIDEEVYDMKVDEDWYSRYNDANTTCMTLINDDNKVIGYLLFGGITKELYDAYISGVLQGDYSINKEMFIHNLQYTCLHSIAIKKTEQGKGYSELLIKAFINGNLSKNVVMLASDKIKKHFREVIVCGKYTVCTLN